MAFSPLDLYALSEAGWWHDASDLSTLWQDSSGTIPVVSNGDPVGKWDDKSGNGNHGTQTIAAQRMLWESSTNSVKNNGTLDGFLNLPTHTWSGAFTFAGVIVPTSTVIWAGRAASSQNYFGMVTTRPRLAVNNVNSFGTVTNIFPREMFIGWRDGSNNVRGEWMGVDTRAVSTSSGASEFNLIGRISTGTYTSVAGRLLECFSIERVLTESEKNNIRDYFETKWDVGLLYTTIASTGTGVSMRGGFIN